MAAIEAVVETVGDYAPVLVFMFVLAMVSLVIVRVIHSRG